MGEVKDYEFVGGRWDGKRFTEAEIGGQRDEVTASDTVYDYVRSDGTTHYYVHVPDPDGETS